MLVTIKSFGSLWSRRFGKDVNDPRRFVRATYYNTTGIRTGENFKYRWKIGGDLRFYGVGCGFDPNAPFRSINQTFECRELEIWQGHNRVAFKRRVGNYLRQDYFLIVTTAEQTGRIVMENQSWKAPDVFLVSVSEFREFQEAILLMPAYSWVRGTLGTFFVETSSNSSLNGELRLEHSL